MQRCFCCGAVLQYSFSGQLAQRTFSNIFNCLRLFFLGMVSRVRAVVSVFLHSFMFVQLVCYS